MTRGYQPVGTDSGQSDQGARAVNSSPPSFTLHFRAETGEHALDVRGGQVDVSSCRPAPERVGDGSTSGVGFAHGHGHRCPRAVVMWRALERRVTIAQCGSARAIPATGHGEANSERLRCSSPSCPAGPAAADRRRAGDDASVRALDRNRQRRCRKIGSKNRLSLLQTCGLIPSAAQSIWPEAQKARQLASIWRKIADSRARRLHPRQRDHLGVVAQDFRRGSWRLRGSRDSVRLFFGCSAEGR